MTREEIIHKVQVKLEELSPYDDEVFLVSNNNVKPIKSYIDETLNDACNEVLMLLPHYVIKNPAEIDDSELTIQDGVGYLPVPDDFLKLHTFSLKSWKRDVNIAIGVMNPAYRLQRNKYTRGKSEKPVVAINRNKFELYSAAEGDELVIASYIPMTLPENLDDKLVTYLVDYCAVKVYDIIENTDQSKVMLNEIETKITTINI